MSIEALQSEVIRGATAEMMRARAVMKEAETEILFLRASDKIKTRALREARQKLKGYRAERRSDVYNGGMEYTALMAFIEEAIGP